MCNGNNHSSDCACGFGPPYTVKGTSGQSKKKRKNLKRGASGQSKKCFRIAMNTNRRVSGKIIVGKGVEWEELHKPAFKGNEFVTFKSKEGLANKRNK